jgi:hypothetical protein
MNSDFNDLLRIFNEYEVRESAPFCDPQAANRGVPIKGTATGPAIASN